MPLRFIRAADRRAALCFMLLTIIGCNRDQDAAIATSAMASPAAAQAREVANAPAPPPARANAIALRQAAAAPTTRLIRTAELRIQTASIARAMLAADSIAKLHDALITDSRSNESPEGPRDGQFVVRVPSGRFTETLMALRSLGEVRNEAIGTQDITREYADLETRIAVKRETVGRLRDLLANRTGKLSDVLDVERELSRTVTELEQMEGEQRYYDAQLAVSSITVYVTERAPALRATLTEPIIDALKKSGEIFSLSVSWLVYIVTFAAPWIVIAGAGWWLIRRRAIWTRRA